MLEVKNLHKRFGPIHAVRGISFTVGKGEVLGFLGPNGAGKSTTMRVITGFLPPTEGTAIVNGFDVVRNPTAAKRQIGYLPENAPVYGDMAVYDFLRFIATIRGYAGAAQNERVEAAIDKCQLHKVRHQSIETLSKGYRQRVCFAQAILHDPPILIMDEPTDGLDPNQKHIVRTMIQAMAREKVIVISTHILEEVEAVCTRAIIIANGTIVANGTPADLKARSVLHGAVEFTLANAPAATTTELGALPAAARVVRDGDRFRVLPRGAGLPAEVGALVKSRGWDARDLRVLEGRLDELFRELTTGEEQVRRAHK
jgi:ABC-2 type transport system ATP-binding protein